MGSYTLFWECKVSKLIGTESITVALSLICVRKKNQCTTFIPASLSFENQQQGYFIKKTGSGYLELTIC
jgi:hypothetical protein